MSVSKRLLTIAAPAALLALSACATGLPTQVSRFQAMPAPQGQSFVIQSGDPTQKGSLQFSQYANLVRQHLIAQGYTEAPSAQAATLIVNLDYGVDEGEQRVVASPGAYSPFGYYGMGMDGYRGGFGGYRGGFDAFGRPIYGYDRYGRPRLGSAFDDPFFRPYYSRYGYAGRTRSPFYYGWNDPYWYSPYGYGYEDMRTYTVYTSHLDMDIKRAADGQSVFEGSAKARSRTDNLQVLVPNLVEAMFTNFPGKSGETVRITVPPAPRGR
ncbi:MAG TPA: DUF4136 domain-containing protein [Allosphingosinicella sp.]|nr:DUF4136 domain-containing protein [Allosphingosinicella sp.]